MILPASAPQGAGIAVCYCAQPVFSSLVGHFTTVFQQIWRGGRQNSGELSPCWSDAHLQLDTWASDLRLPVSPTILFNVGCFTSDSLPQGSACSPVRLPVSPSHPAMGCSERHSLHLPWANGSIACAVHKKAATTRGRCSPYVVGTQRTNGPISSSNREGDCAEIYTLLWLRHCLMRINHSACCILWNPHVLCWHTAVERKPAPLRHFPFPLTVMDGER